MIGKQSLHICWIKKIALGLFCVRPIIDATDSTSWEFLLQYSINQPYFEQHHSHWLEINL